MLTKDLFFSLKYHSTECWWSFWKFEALINSVMCQRVEWGKKGFLEFSPNIWELIADFMNLEDSSNIGKLINLEM